MASMFNKPGYNVVDPYTYALTGDGCLMEGVASEACSLAGTQKLGKLILLYDRNKITIEGETEYADLASSLPSIEEELELEGATHEEAEAAIRTLDAAVGAFFVDNDDLAYEPEQD